MYSSHADGDLNTFELVQLPMMLHCWCYCCRVVNDCEENQPNVNVCIKL